MNWRILKNKNSPGETLFHINFAGRKRNFGNKNIKALPVVIFLVFSGIIFFTSSNTVSAAVSQSSCKGEGASWNATSGNCVCSDFDGQKRIFSEYKGGCALADTVATGITGNNPYKNDGSNAGAAASMPGAGTETIYGDSNNIFLNAIKWVLSKVLELVGWLFAIAATIFAWVVDPANVSGANGMLNKQAVKDVWIMVRDLLNMGFILVLLFAAFGTIFQVDSLNLKKVWLNILINALLVNFSYPIARFIIDISNVAFYYFLNNLFSPNGETAVSGSSIFAGFGNSSNLAGMLAPGDYASHDIAYLIASIVVVFILGMTLMIIAGLFVVRLVALTMLVMFSPIGFVGFILPSTKSYANKWWKNLLNYSFFAPIMIFGMAIALRIMEAMKNENFKSFISNANANAPGDQANFIAGAAFYFIPIIILWSTIGIAKSSGIEFADKVTGSVKKWGNKIANIPWAGTKMGWRATGIPGGFKQTKDYYAKRGVKLPGFKDRHFGSDQTEGTNAWVAQNIGRVPNAYNNNVLKKMGEAAKEHNMEDLDKVALQRIVDTGSEAERLAALEQLAKGGDIKSGDLQSVINEFGEKSQIGKRILSKVKESRPDLAFAHITDDAKREDAMRGFINSDKFDAKKLGSKTLQNVEFMSTVISEGKLDQKAVDALNAKDKKNGDILKQTVTTVANRMATQSPTALNMKNPTTRNVQAAHFAFTGNIHGALDDRAGGTSNQRAEIFKKLNKDSAANLSMETVNKYSEEIAVNLDSGKLVDVIKGMKDKTAKQALVREIERLANNALPPNPANLDEQNILSLARVIDNDSFLKSLR